MTDTTGTTIKWVVSGVDLDTGEEYQLGVLTVCNEHMVRYTARSVDHSVIRMIEAPVAEARFFHRALEMAREVCRLGREREIA
jgi:hypothetical protein